MSRAIGSTVRFDGTTVGLIGVGVVGDALRQYFVGRGAEVRVYDCYKHLGSPEEVNRADLVFICVPTPYDPDIRFDPSAVESSLDLIGAGKTVVIKSTILPGTTTRLQQEHRDKTILFNPEFLREKTAARDFINPDLQIIGCGPRDVDVAQAVLQLLPRAPYEAVLPATNAELVKYAINSFLALKVTFANELYDLTQALDGGYEDVRAGLAADPRIGGSHLDVLDAGYRGYGGKCLPKDTMALIDLADALGVRLDLIRTAHLVNQRLRGELEPSEAELRAA